MIAASPVFSQIVAAASLLYVLLGLATLGVNIGTRARPASQLRLQVYAWWLIFPVVSVSLYLYPLGPSLLVLLIGALAARELLRLWQGLGRTHTHLLLATFVFALAGVSFILALARGSAGPSWLFYLFVLTALNDIGQFVTGTLFGRQKVAPTISPNKTWQGLAGGVAISVLLSLALGSFLALAPARWLAGAGAALALAGFAGDIAFSFVKRRLAIKDFSTLIPGHGGILDRVDSLVLTAPLLYFAIALTL
ncbi:MAG: phosphatidate cytidylyltransferase [Gammaproteobacteria bacterium]